VVTSFQLIQELTRLLLTQVKMPPSAPSGLVFGMAVDNRELTEHDLCGSQRTSDIAKLRKRRKMPRSSLGSRSESVCLFFDPKPLARIAAELADVRRADSTAWVSNSQPWTDRS